MFPLTSHSSKCDDQYCSLPKNISVLLSPFFGNHHRMVRILKKYFTSVFLLSCYTKCQHTFLFARIMSPMLPKKKFVFGPDIPILSRIWYSCNRFLNNINRLNWIDYYTIVKCLGLVTYQTKYEISNTVTKIINSIIIFNYSIESRRRKQNKSNSMQCGIQYYQTSRVNICAEGYVII